jgi:hypothetical protein
MKMTEPTDFLVRAMEANEEREDEILSLMQSLELSREEATEIVDQVDADAVEWSKR